MIHMAPEAWPALFLSEESEEEEDATLAGRDHKLDGVLEVLVVGPLREEEDGMEEGKPREVPPIFRGILTKIPRNRGVEPQLRVPRLRRGEVLSVQG